MLQQDQYSLDVDQLALQRFHAGFEAGHGKLQVELFGRYGFHRDLRCVGDMPSIDTMRGGLNATNAGPERKIIG